MVRKKEKKKLKIDLDLKMLDTMIYYIYSNNGNASKKTLVKMKELFSLLDKEVFEEDRQLEVRYYLINRALEGKLDRRITDEQILSSFILSGGEFDDEVRDIFYDMDDEEDLCDDEVYFVDEFISDRLQYGYLFQCEDDLDAELQKLRVGDFATLGDLNEGFKNVIASLYNNMKKAESQTKFASRDFGTDGIRLDCAISQTISNLKQSRNRIKTGIKWLNSMLRGGFQCARVYMFVGVLKGWKSGLLLNIALWAKHYNKDVKTIDPHKKPAVLYVTLENSIDETIERLWSYYVSEDDELEYHTTAEAFDIIREKGFNEEGVHIEIKYRPNRSLNADGISAMLDDMVLDGYEPIMVVVDYIKRLTSIEKHTELRLELGSIVNELTTLSKFWNLPVITATQMNREALRMMDEGKVNAGKRMGSAQIGESTLMLENADYAFIITREERKSTGNQYLTIKNNASRGKTSGDYVSYFAHPFENGMRLKEDEGLATTLSLADLGDDLINFDPTGSKDIDSSELPTESRRLPRPIRTKKTANKAESLSKITGILEEDEVVSL